MSQLAIEAKQLGKKYRLGSKQEMYYTLRDTLVQICKTPWLRLSRLLKGEKKEFPYLWALKDVSFAIEPGEAVGIIGRNGAGKSTLLKVLSRITEPTEGRATLHGRVGSLLEVGTGFHPELTGRENIFLNGAILGMQRQEIRDNFEQIVEFAGVEKFIDTPMKHYSSGMYLRLAFAVAAHLEPEILLVDEILAVGDAAFQKKCLNKMQEVTQHGQTVIMVSHDLAAISKLCQRGIFLEHGQIAFDGPVEQAIECYLARLKQSSGEFAIGQRSEIQGTKEILFDTIYCNTPSRSYTDILTSGEDIEVVAEYHSASGQSLKNVLVAVTFYNHKGQEMFLCLTRVLDMNFSQVPEKGKVVARVPHLPLPEGSYYLDLYSEINGVVAYSLKEALSITVVGGDFFGTGRQIPKEHGGVLVEHSWEFREI